MSFNFALWQNSRLYSAVESSQGTAVSLTSVNAMRYTSADLDGNAAILTPNNKTGTRDQSRYAKGRRKGTWEVVADIAGSGSAGTALDSNPLWIGAFGVTPTISASTSVTYNLADTIPTVTIGEFKNNPTSLNSKIAISAIVREMKVSFGQDFAVSTFTGDSTWCLDSTTFSSATVTEKGGIGSFPAEPGTQVYNGTEIVGFTGSISVASNVIAEVRSGDVTITTGNNPNEDLFGSFYPSGTYGARRNVVLNIDSYDTDSTGLTTMRQNALTQTPVAVSLQIGTVAGNILTITLGRVILAFPKAGQNADRFTDSFQGCLCLSSTDSAKDSAVAIFT